MADLRVNVNGLTLPNPFIIASGPPGTNANVIARAFDEGWGAVVAKTVCLDATRIVNVSPRYARMRANQSREVVGWENIELISDRPFDLWLKEFRQLKQAHPDRVLIASIMEEHRCDAWLEIVERCADAGVDAFELNLSCPHGLPEQRMGAAMGEDPRIVEEVCQWVRSATDKPVWAKLTPNVTDIRLPGAAALRGGADGLSAINTLLCVMSINLDTLRPEPTVNGQSTAGGYSGKAIRPIALRMCVELAQMIRGDCDDDTSVSPSRTLSAIGGIETGEDAAQFILAGANTVQVCTGVMIHGYSLIHQLKYGLTEFMHKHGFNTIDDFRGASLNYFTSHSEIAASFLEQQARRAARLRSDSAWSSERITEQADELVAER
jgi:dihydroorotate dehydrogenase subfamily 1